MKQFQVLDRFGKPSDLVIRQRQVHSYLRIIREFPERGVVFRNGFRKLSVFDQRRAQVRADLGGIGIILEEFTIEPDGSCHIAGLVGRDGGTQ